MKQFIVKIQMPLYGLPEVLIYNEKRDFQTIIPLDEELLLLFGKKRKAKVYWKAHLHKKKLVLDEEVEEQDW